MSKPDFISNFERYQLDCSRRTFLQRSFAGLGGMALSQLMGGGTTSDLPFLQAQGGLHFPARAKRVIHLCMAGGPSQLESFDPKPQLDAHQRQSRFPNPSPPASNSPNSKGANSSRADPSPSSNATANPASKSPNFSRTSAPSPTTSASSARWSPSRSTTTRPTRS